jgi:transposase-like protein
MSPIEDAIEDAIKEIESLKPGERLNYKKIANRHDVERSTLSRRHRAVTVSVRVMHELVLRKLAQN